MKYGIKKNLLAELKILPSFTKEDVFQLGREKRKYNLSKSTIDTYIARFLKNKDIIPLKRGAYVAADFYDKHKNNTAFLFYLANILRKPSYVSSWTALQYYGLSTEVMHTVMSVTAKKTSGYKTKIGTFAYQSIKKELITNFSLIKDDENGFDYFIATPAKALFDLLYFKTRQFRGVAFKDVDSLIEELRIDMSEMNKKEREKFYSMIKEYTS